MKRHLLPALTAVISLVVLVCSLATWPSLERILLVKMRQAISERANHRKSDPGLIPAGEEIRPPRSRILASMRLMAGAGYALLELLRKAMTLGGYATVLYSWQLYVRKPLRTKMATVGIGMDDVRKIFQMSHLFPVAFASDIEGWPLEVYTLGEFRVVKDGETVRFSGEEQKEPLLMLKALLALGGKEIKEKQVSDLLWPESDAEAAHRAFTTTLSRLRQGLGIEKAIELREGRVTLNSRHCWVDLWAFEQIQEQAEAELRRISEAVNQGEEEDETITQLAGKVIRIYRGHFLPADTEHSWTIACRERLGGKFIHLVIRLGDYLQKTDRYEEAAELYQKAIEVDDLAEEFYQNLMECYRNLGQQAEAIALYHRCEETLAALGIEPSLKTRGIYQDLLLDTRPECPCGKGRNQT